MVGAAGPLVAGMEIARLAVHSMETDGMQRRLNPTAPQIVDIRTNVPPRWHGWRFTAEGQFLVSPDGEHITPHRLAGLLWRDAMELRRAGLRSRKEAEKRVLQGRVKVVVVDLADWHARHFGSRAG